LKGEKEPGIRKGYQKKEISESRGDLSMVTNLKEGREQK